jgi:hypothetical protein
VTAGRNSINGQFIAHRRSMRESPAWRALPDNARRVLDRLELEHMAHSGKQNGRLQCTYDDFERAGLRRRSITLAIRQCVALGFIEVTRGGYKTAGDVRVPSLYRLTYPLNADARRQGLPTDEWAKVADEAMAAALLALAAEKPAGRHPDDLQRAA